MNYIIIYYHVCVKNYMSLLSIIYPCTLIYIIITIKLHYKSSYIHIKNTCMCQKLYIITKYYISFYVYLYHNNDQTILQIIIYPYISSQNIIIKPYHHTTYIESSNLSYRFVLLIILIISLHNIIVLIMSNHHISHI